MAKISIIITGIALSYEKDSSWKVLFPFGECHEIKFRYSIGNTWSSSTPLAKAKRQIKIRIKSPTVPSYEVGNYYHDFIDFTGAYAHDQGLEMVDGWQEKGVLLTIPNAIFRLLKFTNTKYVLNEVSAEPNRTVFGPAIVGYSGVAHIETDAQGLEVLLIDPEEGTTVLQSFDSDATIWFDNNCRDSDRSDTYMLYNLIKGANGDARRFSSERDPDDRPTPHKILAPMPEDPIEAILNLPAISSIIDETVDPAVADPPDGVPCHKFRASKSDNLP